MYHRHFATFVETHSHVAVNAFFKRFVVFSLRYDLIAPADLEPVAELVQNLLRTHKKPPPPLSTPPRRSASLPPRVAGVQTT
jgi:MOB kinase activator 1